MPNEVRNELPAQARLTLRLPDHQARRLREVARQRGLSVNCLLNEVTTLALYEFALVESSQQQGPGS